MGVLFDGSWLGCLLRFIEYSFLWGEIPHRRAFGVLLILFFFIYG